jgi:hypothetical protein
VQGFDHRRYVPVLWTKQGERDALARLSTEAHSATRPLFVVPPVETDLDTGRPKKTVAQHLALLPKALTTSWGADDAFLDLAFIDDAPLPNGQHPLDWFSEQADMLGLSLTPVISDSSSAAYVAAANVAASRSGDVCLRLPIGTWPSALGQVELDRLLEEVGQDAQTSHLVLDMQQHTTPSVLKTVQTELSSLPHLHDWRSVTLVGASMPDQIPSGKGLKVLPRKEWAIHQEVVAAAPPRTPTFGDYAVAGTSTGPEIDPRYLNISAILRYTVSSDWLVVRGDLFKGNKGRGIGGAAVPPAAAQLTAHPQFYGAGHCGTDDWLIAVAAKRGGNGNATTWRKWGTLHHVEVATNQTLAIP